MINFLDCTLNISDFTQSVQITAHTMGASLLLAKILKEGNGCIYKDYLSGFTDTKIEEFSALFADKGGRLIEKSPFEDGAGNVAYLWEDGMISLQLSSRNSMNVSLVSLKESFILDFKKEIEARFTQPTKQGYIFAIMRGSGGNLQLTRIGYAGSALERGNYPKKVLADYDYVIKDLKSEDPSGRITILEGAPGTGKTYLVRSILMDVPDALFVLVPPSMVSSLGGPDLLPLLLRTKEDYAKKGPTILILEDADQCLVPRAGDNMSSISSILNLGDGIFGSLFDIRIVATTNARKAEMDPAIIRAGRLSRRLEVNVLSYEEANFVYKRLLGEDKNLPGSPENSGPSLRPAPKKAEFSLAEVYKLARDAGWEPKGDSEELSTEIIDPYEDADY